MLAAIRASWVRRGSIAAMVFAALLSLEVAQHAALQEAPRAVIPVAQNFPIDTKLHLKAQGRLPMPPNTPAAHASSLLAMPKSHPCSVMAFWFAGARESAPDVQVAQSCFLRSSQAWTQAAFVVNRQEIGKLLGYGLRRMGNPVAWLDASGRIHLFVVATGPGGWASSRLLHVRQKDPSVEAQKVVFNAPRILPLSWGWNLSHLVRGAPLALEDGGMVLPAYFELGVKYPVALRFDANGEFTGETRMSRRKNILQPTLIPLNATHWLALMRDNRIDGKIAVAQTGDGGLTWRDLNDLNLSNPDAAIFALTLGPWHFLLAHNSSLKSRQVLDLSESGNGIDWRRIHTLATGNLVSDAAGTKAAEFSYPAMVWADDKLWVSYTEQRTHIAWQCFEMEKSP